MEKVVDKRIKKVLKQLDKKAANFKRAVLGAVSKEFQEGIKNLATKENQDYKKKIELQEKNEETLFVLVDTKKMKITNSPQDLSKDKDAVVFYYKPITQAARQSPATPILTQYQPYPKGYLPLKPTKDYMMVSRSVSRQEAENIVERINTQFDAIRNRLVRSGIDTSLLLDLSTQKTLVLEVTEDLAFRTIRRELGMETPVVPVWLPTVNAFRKGSTMQDYLVKHPDLLMGGKPIKYGKLKATDQDEKDFDHFQEMIIK